jgi:hypothetical protein
MPESIQIPSRFNGPRGSGNGGYAAGVVAGLFGGEAEVNLRSPVPLDTELGVIRDEDGTVRVLDGETLVADARAPTAGLESPEPVSLGDARRAAERYKGSPDDMFSHCFVCGRSREDSFEVFAGTEHVVVAWPIEAEGRKRHAGSALLSAEGETLAVASALLVEPRAR